MRHTSLASIAVGMLAGLANTAIAQQTTLVVPARPPGHPYAIPSRPIEAQPYRWVVVPQVRRPNPTGYVNRPYYGAYGYGFYSNGSTDGFPPFRNRRSR